MPTLLRLIALLFGAALLLGLFTSTLAFALRQLNLYPPEQITMAAGQPGSAYHENALAYRALLAEDGITLNILETAGSVANAALLARGNGEEGGADIALVQGGVPLDEIVEGLAAVYVEPIWLFVRSAVNASTDPNDWDGLRVAAGIEGSGTRLVADRLAEITGAEALGPEGAIAVGGSAAVENLLRGEIDIALFVAPASAEYLRPLYYADDVEYLTVDHAQAVTLRLDAARAIQLPSGILDYRRPIPAQDIYLIGLITRLAAREDLHPALVNRLVKAALEVHGGSELIPANRQYPSSSDMEIEANPYAAQLLQDGFSSLEKLFPYWVVAQLNRILLVLLPAIFLLLPILKLLPLVYQWVFRGKVYRHYSRVHEIDRLVGTRGETLNPAEREALREELTDIEGKLRAANLPNSYRKQAYTLLHHLEYVRNRIPTPQ